MVGAEGVVAEDVLPIGRNLEGWKLGKDSKCHGITLVGKIMRL